ECEATVSTQSVARKTGDPDTKTGSIVLPRSPSIRTLFNLLDLLPHAGHDPVAGDIQAPGRQAQFGGDRRDLSAFDGGAPESQPGGFLETHASTLRRDGEDLAAIFQIEQGGIGVTRRLGLQELDHFSPSGPEARGLSLAGGEEVDDQIPGGP